MPLFSEAEFETMVVDTLQTHGWKYIPADELNRQLSDVMVEDMVKKALEH